MWETIEGALIDEGTELFWAVFGNPTRNTGRFRECFAAAASPIAGPIARSIRTRVHGTMADSLNLRPFKLPGAFSCLGLRLRCWGLVWL